MRRLSIGVGATLAATRHGEFRYVGKRSSSGGHNANITKGGVAQFHTPQKRGRKGVRNAADDGVCATGATCSFEAFVALLPSLLQSDGSPTQSYLVFIETRHECV